MSKLGRWKLPMLFALTTLGGLGVAYWKFQKEEKTFLLPGQTTHGHHQIEMECNACHTPMMGVKTESCVECHGKELDLADDSHPASKFRDPRNADRLDKLDAMDCVTCHVEHRQEATFVMGVTQPYDYCLHCHEDIAEERPTHEGLGFKTCADAGCHNFHDNRALHEDFLQAHMDDPPHAAEALVDTFVVEFEAPPLTAADQDAPVDAQTPETVAEWAQSGHAAARVNCMGCHAEGAAEGQTDGAWVEAPSIAVCAHCHGPQMEGFQGGKHGMRLAFDLPPMRPGQARQPMKRQAHDRELGCNSCHGPHGYDRGHAAVDACLDCHDDTHSRNYADSPHATLFAAEQAGNAPRGSGVSCATCHLPRVEDPSSYELVVQHNQNDNLRPNDKMVRPVCQQCHGVPFVLDALADRGLIERNFTGKPTAKVESFDMLREKLSSLGQSDSSTPED